LECDQYQTIWISRCVIRHALDFIELITVTYLNFIREWIDSRIQVICAERGSTCGIAPRVRFLGICAGRGNDKIDLRSSRISNFRTYFIYSHHFGLTIITRILSRRPDFVLHMFTTSFLPLCPRVPVCPSHFRFDFWASAQGYERPEHHAFKRLFPLACGE
jgi:hypothetical protein